LQSAGTVEVHFESVSCQSVIDEVASALSPLAVAKGLTFEVMPVPQDCIVQTDRRALSQILINLTNNAIKFTERGYVSLDVARRHGDRQARTESASATPVRAFPHRTRRGCSRHSSKSTARRPADMRERASGSI